MNQLMERLIAVSNQIHNESCDPSTLYSSHQTDKKYKLMIKTHWETGVNYLCITKRSDFKKYTGSGTRWKRLLKAHPGPVITYLLFSTDSEEELAIVARYYSDLLNVESSSDFANLVPEYGYVGNMGNLPAWWGLATTEQKHIARDKSRVSCEITCKEKYDLPHSMHIARLALQKLLDDFGVTNIMKIPEIATKNSESRKASLIEEYGVTHNMNIPGVSHRVQVKRELTMISRYGVTYALQIEGLADAVKEKRESTMISRYGVPNASLIPEVVEMRSQKIRETKAKKVKKKCSYCDFESKNIKYHELYCLNNPNREELPSGVCIHCGKRVNSSNLKRWHNDNCKYKKEQK